MLEISVTFYAHSGIRGDKSDWQALPVHLLAVAKWRPVSLGPFGLQKAAFALASTVTSRFWQKSSKSAPPKNGA